MKSKRLSVYLISIGMSIFFYACDQTTNAHVVSVLDDDSISTKVIQEPIDTDCTISQMNEADEFLYQPIQGDENRIEFFNNNGKDLSSFFCKLDKANEKGTKVRVMHFGDSQVLRDRGTKKLRTLLYQHYKGSGPGLQTVGRYYGGYEHRSLKCTHSSNFEFYDSFLFPNKLVPHNKYGLMSIFSRYAEIIDTIIRDRKAWVEYEPSQFANEDVKEWKLIRMFYQASKGDVFMKLFSHEVLIDSFILVKSESAALFSYEFEQPVNHLRIEFESNYSPDFYGIAFDNEGGLLVDNIGLCGSAGTFFSKIDRDAQSLMFTELETGLIVLQFGGNTVPLTRSQASVDRYTNLMKNQISHIKSILPDVPIIVIGPSDMLYEKDSVTWLTFSWLDDVVDGMRKACSESGAYYWDMYRVMGGKGAMRAWYSKGYVNSDRIHFNTKGINKVMELFYEALMKTNEETGNSPELVGI